MCGFYKSRIGSLSQPCYIQSTLLHSLTYCFAHIHNFLQIIMTSQKEMGLSPKLVVVVGATGGQGGSVIKRLLADGIYQLRGITRNPQSKSSQELTAKGVEMVTADINDLESIVAAFKVWKT